MENSGKKMQNKIGSSIKYGLLGEVRIFSIENTMLR